MLSRGTHSGPELVFDPAHRPEGFTSGNLAGFDGSPEPIVREILQNALDAAHAAGRAAHARFSIREVDACSIPGMDGYRQAFKAASRQRTSRDASHDEKTVIDRIDSALDQPRVAVLMCEDNGIGLDPERMDALLTSGNTSKGAGGAGSYGVGHHAAFAASNLRYVLYGARYRHNGTHRRIASGHAILATFENGRQRFAADGYLRQRHTSAAQQHLPFDGSGSEYLSAAPALLAERLPADSEGSVVCVVGFNDFHRDEHDPGTVTSICRAAAANFAAAIVDGQMSVTVADERDGTSETVNDNTVGSLLEGYAAVGKRASRPGRISGQVALGAYRALTEGSPIACDVAGASLCLLPLAGDGRHITRVHVFRKGMWITSRAPALTTATFGESVPFEAVLSLDNGRLEQLVRDAEGPSHLGIEQKRLSAAGRKALRTLLSGIAETLRAAAGRRDSSEDYTPPGFADLGGYNVRSAERMPRRRNFGGRGSRDAAVPGGERGARSKGGGVRTRGKPRPGTRPDYGSVIKPDPDRRHIEAKIHYREQPAKGEMIGVRLRCLSGSDETCDTPLPDDHPEIRSAVLADHEDNEIVGVSHDAWEVHFAAPPAGIVTMALELTDPLDYIELVELDVVKRRPAGEPTSKTTAA